MRRPLVFFILTLTCTFLYAIGQPKPAGQSTWPIDLLMGYSVTPNVTYSVASNYECKLDVYSRRGLQNPAPTVVLIHGGGWVAGTRESSIFNLLPYFEMGFNAVNVEYRLARVALAPAAVEDCRLALRWVIKNAKTYGFDTSRIVVTGGSAGGHLALMTGMLDASAGFDQPKEWDQAMPATNVAAIINWFGITDVKDILAGANRQNYAVSWLGSQANREELAVRVSPLTYVRKGLPPTLTIHGDSDDLVPYSHATRLHAALTDLNVPNQLVTIRGGKHGGFSRDDMVGSYATIREFLRKHGVLAQDR